MNKNFDNDFTSQDNLFGFPITLYNGKVQTSFSYPTIDNQGLVYEFSKIGIIPMNNYCPNLRDLQEDAILRQVNLTNTSIFNTYEELYGVYGLINVNKPTTARFIVPAGISIRMDRATMMLFGSSTIQDRNRISGEILLPFFDAPEEFINGSLFAQKIGREEAQTMSATIMSLYDENSDSDEINMDKMIFNIVDEVKNGGLIIMGGNTYGQSTIPFNFVGTNISRGFILEHVKMEPTMVGNYDINRAVQRIESTTLQNVYTAEILTELVEQSMVVQSSDVSVDLSVVEKPSTLAENKWYSSNEWKGIILNEGTVTISKDLFTAEGGKPISFTLEPQEMIYDRNGFIYQKSVITKPGEEIKIELGEDFGGFPHARLKGLMLDMYNNQFEFAMEGSVFIKAFNNEEFGIRMYTEKGNGDEKGLVKASLVSKEKIELSTPKEFNGISYKSLCMDVYGGYFDKLGVHINGAVSFNFPSKFKADNLIFNELVIPAYPEEMSLLREDLSQGETLKKGTAYFSEPYKVKYCGFDTELISFDLFADLEQYSLSYINSPLNNLELDTNEGIIVPQLQKGTNKGNLIGVNENSSGDEGQVQFLTPSA